MYWHRIRVKIALKYYSNVKLIKNEEFSLLCIFFCLAVQLSGKSGLNDLPKSDNILYSVFEGNEIVVDFEDKSLISEQLEIDIAKVIEFSESNSSPKTKRVCKIPF